MAALGLRSYMRAFSRCREQELLFSAAHRNSFQGFLLLQGTGSRHVGFSSCGSQAIEGWLSGCGVWAYLSYGMWDHSRPGIKPVCPALRQILYH